MSRLATGNQPDWDITYAEGKQGELLVLRVSESMDGAARFEVKNDRLAAATGNFFLEYRCKISGEWARSGFDRVTDDSSELVSLIVADTVVVTTTRDLVRAVAAKYWRDPANRRDGARDGRNPTKGVVVPIDSLVSELVAAARA